MGKHKRPTHDGLWELAEQLRKELAAEWDDPRYPNCCPRCGWSVTSHGVSSYGLDCPWGTSPAAQAGHLPRQQVISNQRKPTPTTELVRDRYALATVNDTDFPGWEQYKAEQDAEFYRWLADHDREVAEKAWDEGYDTAMRDEDRGSSINPYQSTCAWGCDLTGMAPPAVHIVDNHEDGPAEMINPKKGE